jgi:ABC-type branched-subunit amino acid transport system substrate-binding protein
MIAALAACGGEETVPAPVESPQLQPLPEPAPIPVPKPPAPIAGVPLAAPGTVKVALLVPLSGPNAELGKAMLDAAQLALFTTGSGQLTLVPRDTAGTADGAAKAAHSAVDDGAALILGPLLAGEVEAVKPIAESAHINVIAFSTATQLAGGSVFLMGFLPRDEAVREVGYAHSRGLNRFAALLPNSPYGHLIADAMRQAATAAGASVGHVEFFDPRLPDTSTAVQHLVGAQASLSQPGAAAPVGGGDFDALLLPEGGAQLKQIAAQVKTAGVDTSRVRLLGSGLWDDPSITGDPTLYGGWFAASPPDARRDFESRYENAYHRPAPRLASLAFDAAALAAVLAKAGGDQPFSHEAILNPNGFTGVDGLFRFTDAGLVQRGLAVLEVGPQGDTVVSPAPTNFAGPGL